MPEPHLFKQKEGGEEGSTCQFCAFPRAAVIHHTTTEAEAKGLANMAEAVSPHLDHPRISREAMFLEIVQTIRKRSSCSRGKVGVLIVRDARIVSMGYNGSPPGSPHCFELGCDVIEDNHDAGCQRSIHAEANAVAWAARMGISTLDCTMYSTHSPCLKCAQLIVSCGIKKVIYINNYRLERLDILDESGVKHVRMGPI